MNFSIDFYKSIINNMLDAFALHEIIVDADENPIDYKYLELNKSFEAFTGLKREMTVGKLVSQVIPEIGQDNTDWIEIYGRVALEGKPMTFESYSQILDKWYFVNAYSPKKYYFITIFHDISDLKQKELMLQEKNDALTKISEELAASEEELRQQLFEISGHQETLLEYKSKLLHNTYFDSLTGLPNRSLLYKEIADILNTQQENESILFFLIDLNNMKYINDTLGHFVGDEIIIGLGERLNSITDSNSHLYRFGGDEFLIIRNKVISPQEIEEYASRIAQLFMKPFELMDSQLHVTVSIGVSIYPEHNNKSDELLKFADIAMHQAKNLGKNVYAIFNQAMHNKVRNRMVLEKHLHSALENNELQLHYQPQLEIMTGKIVGLEALLRWQSPQLGNISPLEFIPIAEDTHLIISIGDWVLRNSCYFLKQLHNQGHSELVISVNISVLQLLQENFVEQIKTILEFTQLKPRYLELEITESVIMKSYQNIQSKLVELKAMGVKIALDDFGKGYSSLGELKLLPITTLKIDRSFISAIPMDKISKSIVSMVIKIGRSMNLKVIAEGVENKEQLDFLYQQKCHQIQGYYFSKPLPEKNVWQKLREKNHLMTPSYGKFSWKDKYNLNITEIDDQHKGIFEIGNRISKMVFAANLNFSIDEIKALLEELKNYTEEHFQMEEALMRKNKYIYYRSHKNMHQNFVDTILDFNKELVDLTDKKVLLALLDTVYLWITHHIIHEDTKLKGVIK
ncbi:MAG: bacteriohemerythrin [Peptococcaceae bacterium]|nr:bacteriohemerythrin [Peptococcaceae bacterium]